MRGKVFVNDAELASYEAKGRIEKFSAIFALCVIGLTIFFLGLSAYGLFDVDETRYAASAMEMIRSGNYLIPTFNGVPRLNKPILFYWLLVSGVKLFGVSPGSFRLASAVFAFATCLWLGHLVYRESRVEGGFLAGAILATSPIYAYLGRVVMTDMVFSVLLFSASLFLYLGIFDERKVRRRFVVAGYLSMGLAFLTKGPAGVVLPLASILIFGLVNGRFRRTIEDLLDWWGVLVFLLVSVPWYAAVLFVKGPSFFFDFFIKENILRFLRVTSGHRGPIVYYVPVIFLGMFPWSLFLPQAVFKILRDRGFSLRAFEENVSLDMFLLLYSGVIFVFFSLSATKLPTYVLSIFPALAVIVALYLERVILEVRFPSFGFYMGAYVFSVCVLILGLVLLFPGEYFPQVEEVGISGILSIPTIIFLFAATLTALFTIFRRGVKRVRVKIFAVMLITQLLFIWFAFFGVLPAVYANRQGDLERISAIINQRAGEEDTIVFYRKFKPSVVYFTGKRVAKADSFEEIVALWDGVGKLYLIFKGKSPVGVELWKLGNARLAYRGRVYSLYEIFPGGG